ncbi:MAG: hypothetical protein AAGJ18_04210, partial [Bacteroidota bacterium]
STGRYGGKAYGVDAVYTVNGIFDLEGVIGPARVYPFILHTLSDDKYLVGFINNQLDQFPDHLLIQYHPDNGQII